MKINGVPVIDSPKRLTVTVTESDVEKGNTKDPGKCAAAQALLREKDCSEARVHLGRTYLKMGKKWVRFHTPEALRAEIISFDRGAKFQPGEYTLSPMPPSHKRGKATGSSINKTRSKKLQKPRAKPHVVYGVRQHGANR